MTTLQFDEATHTYRLGGKVLPSVTQVLDCLVDWRHVDRAVLDAAAEFGSHVHQAVDLWNRGVLDEPALDPALRPWLESWKRFLVDTGATVIESEARLACRMPEYAGTADAIVRLGKTICLIDIKTGAVPRTVGPQLAAYMHAWNEAHPDLTVRRRFALAVNGSGYALSECKNPADWSVFLSALNVWRFINAA